MAPKGRGSGVASRTFNIRIKNEAIEAIEAEMEDIREETYGEVSSVGEAVRWLAFTALGQRKRVGVDSTIFSLSQSFRRLSDTQSDIAKSLRGRQGTVVYMTQTVSSPKPEKGFIYEIGEVVGGVGALGWELKQTILDGESHYIQIFQRPVQVGDDQKALSEAFSVAIDRARALSKDMDHIAKTTRIKRSNTVS